MTFQTIGKKMSTALWILQEQGPYSLARFILVRIVEDRLLLGKVVEILGDSAYLDGCLFDLDSPYIATRLKSRFLTGTYEAEARYLIQKYLPRNLPVIEFGAGIGVVSCLTNRLLMNPESHVVVEANKYLLPTLEKNRDTNGCKFRVLNAAIAYDAHEAILYLSDRFDESNIVHKTAQTITVPTITLQGLLAKERFSKVSLVCDIQKAEVELVENEGEVMRNHVEWLVIEMHDFGPSRGAETRSNLEALGFCLIEQREYNHLYHNQGLCARVTY